MATIAKLMSLNEEIERINFVRFPTRASRGILKVVRVESLIMADLGNRTVACSRDMRNFAYPCNSRGFPWMDNVIEGLRRLGCISAKAAAEHTERAKQNGERAARKFDAERFSELAGSLGIDLTGAQRKTVQNAKRDGSII